MSEQSKSKKKTFENSFASLLFPEENHVSQKPLLKKKQQIELRNKVMSQNISKTEQRPQPQSKLPSQLSSSNQLLIQKTIVKKNDSKNNSDKASKVKQPSLSNNTSINNGKRSYQPTEIQKKAKIDNNDPMLNKLKNFNCLDDLVKSLEQGKDDFKKYFSSNKKDLNHRTGSKVKIQNEDKKHIPVENSRNNPPLQPRIPGKEIKSVNKDFLNKKRNPPTAIVQHSKPVLCNKPTTVSQPNKVVDFKKLINIQKEKTKHQLQKKEVYNPVKQSNPSKHRQPPTITSNQKIEAKLSQLVNLMKGNSKSVTNKKVSKKNGLFSQEDFEDNDSFIVDDEEDDDPYQYRKHLAKINHKLMRGRTLYDDDGDLEEANFDTIQREEKITADIGEYEDQLEEIKELKRQKLKSNKTYS